ncbi:MAG: nucleotide-binding domain containing protein, partial [Bacteroidota bacterium]
HHLTATFPHFKKLEIDVETLLNNADRKRDLIAYSGKIDQWIEAGQSVLLYTSRKLITVATEIENQQLGQRISNFIADIVTHLRVSPKYILTKGGITSSDVATKGLGIKKAWVLGQIIPGVPVWRLGQETKFPGSSQIIFPGNVGKEESLSEVVHILESSKT